MNAEKKNTIIKKVQIILLVLASILFIYGCVVSRTAGIERKIRSAADDIEFSVTAKANDQAWSSTLYYDFSCTIKNNSNVEIHQIVGNLKIMDRSGNVLSSGKAHFNGEFTPDAELYFTLNWHSDMSVNAETIWNSDYSDLTFSFEVTELTDAEYRTVSIKK